MQNPNSCDCQTYKTQDITRYMKTLTGQPDFFYDMFVSIFLFHKLMYESYVSNVSTVLEDELFFALKVGDLKLVKKLLKKNINLNVSFGKAEAGPLHIACYYGYSEIVEILLKNGATVNSLDSERNTALHLCCIPLFGKIYDGHIKIAKSLIAYGAQIDAENDINCTPLILASSNTNIEIIELLLKSGANINKRNENGLTCLHEASYTDRNNTSILQLMLQNNADINLCDHEGWSPIVLSTLAGNIENIKLLLENGAQLNTNVFGIFPLHFACAMNRIDIVKLLLEYNANTNIKNEEGKTALQYAIDTESSNIDELKLLFNIHKENKENKEMNIVDLESQIYCERESADNVIEQKNITEDLSTSIKQYIGGKYSNTKLKYIGGSTTHVAHLLSKVTSMHIDLATYLIKWINHNDGYLGGSVVLAMIEYRKTQKVIWRPSDIDIYFISNENNLGMRTWVNRKFTKNIENIVRNNFRTHFLEQLSVYDLSNHKYKNSINESYGEKFLNNRMSISVYEYEKKKRGMINQVIAKLLKPYEGININTSPLSSNDLGSNKILFQEEDFVGIVGALDTSDGIRTRIWLETLKEFEEERDNNVAYTSAEELFHDKMREIDRLSTEAESAAVYSAKYLKQDLPKFEESKVNGGFGRSQVCLYTDQRIIVVIPNTILEICDKGIIPNIQLIFVKNTKNISDYINNYYDFNICKNFTKAKNIDTTEIIMLHQTYINDKVLNIPNNYINSTLLGTIHTITSRYLKYVNRGYIPTNIVDIIKNKFWHQMIPNIADYEILSAKDKEIYKNTYIQNMSIKNNYSKDIFKLIIDGFDSYNTEMYFYFLQKLFEIDNSKSSFRNKPFFYKISILKTFDSFLMNENYNFSVNILKNIISSDHYTEFLEKHEDAIRELFKNQKEIFHTHLTNCRNILLLFLKRSHDIEPGKGIVLRTLHDGIIVEVDTTSEEALIDWLVNNVEDWYMAEDLVEKRTFTEEKTLYDQSQLLNDFRTSKTKQYLKYNIDSSDMHYEISSFL